MDDALRTIASCENLADYERRGLKMIACTNDDFFIARLISAELPLEVPALFNDYYQVTGMTSLERSPT